MQATYQTRIEGNDEGLSAYAALYGRVQRRLFAEVSSGRSAASMKRGCVRECGIPARMFNAVRVSLEGKVSGARESQLLHAETLKGMVRRAGRELANAGKKGDRHGVHQKTRRLDNLRSRLARVEADMAAGLVRLCFGGRKLWRKQHHLEANGYASHEEWLADWRAARDGEFFVLGSRDETGGCQLCVAAIADDGSLTLRLRMPDCLAGEHGKYRVIEGVKFAYGHGQVLAALQANLEFAECRRRDGERAARATSLGQAISYRFKRDEKGWRVFVTTDLAPVPAVTDRRLGAIGVDLNAGHLAVAETDASGNYLRAWRVPLLPVLFLVGPADQPVQVLAQPLNPTKGLVSDLPTVSLGEESQKGPDSRIQRNYSITSWGLNVALRRIGDGQPVLVALFDQPRLFVVRGTGSAIWSGPKTWQ